MISWWYLFKRNLSKSDCEHIVSRCLELEPQKAKVGHGGQNKVSEIRKSTVRWVPRKDEVLHWLMSHITLNALEANDNCFYLDLSNRPRLSYSDAQFTEYEAEESGKYDWHIDCREPQRDAPMTDRKLSMVTQLSPADSYEGGRLEFDLANPIPENDFRNQGDMIFFPSHLRHRVTPVTKGVRRSLVMWFNGPNLR